MKSNPLGGQSDILEEDWTGAESDEVRNMKTDILEARSMVALPKQSLDSKVTHKEFGGSVADNERFTKLCMMLFS